MAFVSAQKSRILAGDYSLSAKTAQVTAPFTGDMLNVTTLADTAKVFIPGQNTSTFTIAGFLDTDATADLQFDQMNDWTSAEPVTFGPQGFALGNETWGVHSLKTVFTTGAAVADSVRFDLSCQTDGITDMGRSLHDLTAETADQLTPTSYDGGASSANGGAGYLHVTAFSGFSSAVIKVQDSSDNSVFADLVTFTTVTGLTSERVAVTGTVDQFLRYTLDVTGTGSITFQVGFARR